MSISGKMISAIDSILHAFRSGTKAHLKDYTVLESVVNPTTIVANDGSLATIFELYGSKKYVGDEEIRELEERLYSSLKSSLQKEGHMLQFVFLRDKDRVEDYIREQLKPYRDSAKNLGLKMDDLFDSKIECLKKQCTFESCYLVAWSKPELIKEVLKEEQEANNKRSQKAPLAIDAQNIIIEYERLEYEHLSFCDEILDSFKNANLNISKLHVRKALKEIRNAIDYSSTSKDWEASIPIPLDINGDIIKLTSPMKEEKKFRSGEKDVSSLLWPSISTQIFTDKVDVIDSNIIKMGSKYISSMYVEIPPQIVKPFKSLINSMDSDIPLQISFTLETGGLNKEKMKAAFASILAVTNSGNKMVRDSINYLRELDSTGEAIVKMTINAITWAKEESVLNMRKQRVIKTLQSWGNAQVVFNNIDPIEGAFSVMPSVMNKGTGNSSLAPLEDIIQMLPLSRQSHVWNNGSILFRTDDGKLFPYQPGSSIQNTWNDIIFALPGSGKSVLMNVINLATVIQAGNKKLPYIGIIDIGPSTEGFIQLIKDSLPEDKKHLAIYERLQNDKRFAINIFDTHLGCRFPTPSDMAFLKNFVTLLMTPAGKKPYDATDALVSKVIEKTYAAYSDDPDAQPKMYRKGLCPVIDKVLAQLNIDSANRSWWFIVDELFKKGQKRYAGIAQRYAVPVLEDLTSIAYKTPSIRDEYSKPMAVTKENMLELFKRSVSEAVQQYPMLNMPTVFDISESRIISLDLDEVAKGNDDASVKQTGIMYMLARNIVGRKFKLSPKEIEIVAPPLFKKHLVEEASEIKETRKRLCLDEFHRTKGQASIREQVIVDQREGRKWNLQVTLASQQIDDFSEEMKKNCTGVFILSGGSDNYKELADTFDLNATTAEIVKMDLNGPTSAGAPFVFNCKTKKGEYSQFLYSTISAIELWAFTTTAEDVTLKTKLTKELGSPEKARELLAKEFGHSAKERIELIQLDTENPKRASDPYSYLIKEIKRKYNVI